jgi:hypothetical protein
MTYVSLPIDPLLTFLYCHYALPMCMGRPSHIFLGSPLKAALGLWLNVPVVEVNGIRSGDAC